MAHSKHLNKEEKNVVLAYRRAFKKALRKAEMDMREVQYLQHSDGIETPKYEFNQVLDTDYNTWLTMSLYDKILEVRKIEVTITAVPSVYTEDELSDVMARLEEDETFEV